MDTNAKRPKRKPSTKAILSTPGASKSSPSRAGLRAAKLSLPDPETIDAVVKKISSIRRAALKAGLDEAAEDRALAKYGPVEKLHWPSEISMRTFSLKKRGRKTANA